MGGHGVHVEANTRNIQETDEEMLFKIQRIDTIKHNPNHFHLVHSDPTNWSAILGGAPTLTFGAAGAFTSYSYYAAQARPFNFYANNFRVFGRLFFGATLGLAFGYSQFGDRQRLHNAWVAERLRRRYPESIELNTTDLWRLKGVKAPHTFYRWV